LIVNAAECEPLLKSDQYAMRSHPEKLVAAACEAAELTGAARVVFALKRTYEKERLKLGDAIAATKSPVELFLMRPVYPAGDEQVVIREVTGLTVPPGGIPLQVGCVVISVSTTLALADAMDGAPFTSRYVTVAGEVKSPQIFRVPIGTPVSGLISAAGGATKDDVRIVMGGPMMGKLIAKDMEKHAVIRKTDGGVLLLPGDHPLVLRSELSIDTMSKRARSVCIQCQSCTDSCPRHLLGHQLSPHKIMRSIAYGHLGANDSSQALLCSECGLCEVFACQMGLSPRRINAHLKTQPSDKRLVELADIDPFIRNGRQIDAHRVAYRAGIANYDFGVPESSVTLHPETVSIPLKQHIGSPCEPLVKEGDSVIVGQIIGTVPEGALGAPIHASVDGVVDSAGDPITIVARGGANA
jgi:Na+-translocating ferredoxin:NAD+ oxidoreductase RnfC subunit